MRTQYRNQIALRWLLGLSLALPFVQGCKKNEDFIVEDAIPLNVGIRLSVDEGDFEYDAIGRFCEEDGDVFIVVANNEALLTFDVAIDELATGDFVVFRTGTESPDYAVLYVHEVVENEVTTVYILIGEPDFIGNVLVEDDLIQGEMSGVFTSIDGEFEVPFNLSFTSQLVEDTTLCD